MGIAALSGLLAIGTIVSAHSRATAAGDDGTLRGVATGDGGPAADADVAAGIVGWAPAAGDRVAAVKTDAEGRFTLAHAPLGPIDVWVHAKGGKWRFVIRMWNPGVNDLAVDAQSTIDYATVGTAPNRAFVLEFSSMQVLGSAAHVSYEIKLWEDGRILLNMEDTRLRLGFMRRDSRVALTVLGSGEDGWYRHVSLLGRIVSIAGDDALEDIDRLALRYTGKPFRRRDRARVSAWLEPERWHTWG